jgi:TPP-dependent pyruvate/acetoin dehydrogenase alpha subunit
MGASEPFENPLVPNARLKQILLAMHRVRAIEQALPLKQRSGATGLEACLVAAAVDLAPRDLVSDALHGVTIDFLRGTPLHRALEPSVNTRKKAVLADSGAARPLPWNHRHEDRLWMALGAAAALRASHVPGESETSQTERAALVCYLREGQVDPSTLSRVFQIAQEQRLPAVFVALPGSLKNEDGSPGPISRLASRSGVPAISTDRDDAVALYRVAQESLGRARAGGGPALIECVPFIPKRNGNIGQTTGPLSVIEGYVLARKIVSPEWIARESRAFARHLPHPVH